MIEAALDFFTGFLEVIKLISRHAEFTDETASEYALLKKTLNGGNYFRHLYNGG